MKSIEQLCLLQKRIQFETVMRNWCPDDWSFAPNNYGGYEHNATELSWIAWQSSTAVERLRVGTNFETVRALAQLNSCRADDCGVLAAALLAALDRL